MATDVSEPTPLVGQPRVIGRGIVWMAERMPDGYQEVAYSGHWGMFLVAPIEYDIQPGDALVVYGRDNGLNASISHVRINDGPATPQNAGYVLLWGDEASRA